MRGAEAFDLLQALNTGHLGSLSTIHANSAEQALTRLAHCVLTANVGLPHRSTREAIALAIHLVVHIARVDGRRRVTEVVAVRGYDGEADRFVLESRCSTDGRARKESPYERTTDTQLSPVRRPADARRRAADGASSPTAPSAPQSFLAGTWRGTLTIQPNPTGPQPPRRSAVR